MTQIKKVKTSEGVQFYPQTHTKAVIDDNGYTAESRLGAMQDEINQAQLAVGAVPSDLAPTEDSSNWVTSGGMFNALYDSVEVFTNSSEITWSAGNINSQGAIATNYANMYTIVDIEANVEYRLRLNNSTSFKLNIYKYVNNKWTVISGLSSLTGEVTMTFTVTDSTRILFMFWDKPTAAQAQAIPLSVDIVTKKYVEYSSFDSEPTNGSSNPVTSDGVYNALPCYEKVLFQNTSSTAWATGNINASSGAIESYANKYYIIRLPESLHDVYFYRQPSSFDVVLKVSNSQTSGYVSRYIGTAGKLNVEGYRYLAIVLYDKPTLEQAQAEEITIVDRCLASDIDNKPVLDSINLISSSGVYDAMYIDRLTTGNGITWIQGGINGQTGVYETNANAICTEPIFINGDANASAYPGYLAGYNVGMAVYDINGTFRTWGASVDISSLGYLVGYVRFVHYGSSSMYPTPSDGASTDAYVVKHKMIEERLAALEDYKIKTYSNPVCAVDFADPTVWDGEDGYYYALATGSVTGRTMKRSANLVDWEDTNDLPYTSDVADAILSNFGSNTIYWAPCVYKVSNTQWNMYLTKPRGGVVFLTSSYPTMGYQFVKYTSAPFGDYIDADVARDRDGKLWMFAGSSGMMHRRQMTDNGLDFAENSSWEHVAGRPSGESGNTDRIKTFEGEYLYRRGGYWYLFCSSGKYENSTYAIRVVRSQTLDGTFVDKEGNLATEGYAETIMSSGGSLYGPGHNAQIIVDRDNKTWMLYHSHWSGASSPSHRGLCLDEVKWDENGWPYFEGGVPSLTHVVPNM